MTRKTLFRWIIGVMIIYIIIIALGITLRIVFPDRSGQASIQYQTFKDLVPFLIAIPAAWIGFCFQRRASYLSALRQLWSILIPAIQQAIQYTHLPNPKDEDFAKVQKDLSITIDSLRGVFSNLDNKEKKGLYPYEPLKDISNIITWLKFSADNSEEGRFWARKCITRLWYQMHYKMLLEFDREEPVYPVSKYLDDECSLADCLCSHEKNDDGNMILNKKMLESIITKEKYGQKR